MGNPKYVHLYSRLLAFLEERGHSLLESGTTERGLNIQDTREFLDILAANQVPLLGIEIWRRTNDHYDLEGQEVWVPVDAEATDIHQDALHYLSTIGAGPDDVLTVQFG
jgi:hypothetical protein